jgi:hypothetical protein
MPDCTETRGAGQTALEGDNDGLGAVSHIQAHPYYADRRARRGWLGIELSKINVLKRFRNYCGSVNTHCETAVALRLSPKSFL